jgi:hypothetical protein
VVSSSPSGARITLDDKSVLGKTPGTFTLPCGAPVKLHVHKARYVGEVKEVTPSAEGAQLAVHLARATFAVRVISTPAGATIKLGGRVLGVTPTTIRLPSYACSTIVLSKAGYANEARRITPRSNNTAHRVVLRRGRRRR